MTQLCDSDWAGQVRLALQPPKKFAKKARCTLRDIGANYDDFIKNFENGGWTAWIKISESQSNNNPYSYFLSAVDEKMAKETQKRLSLEKELTASGGFLGIKNCVQISCISGIDNSGKLSYETEQGKWKEDEVPKDKGFIGTLGRTCSCAEWETETPGKIMADSLSKTVFKDVEWLQQNSEWYNYVVAIGNAVVNRLTKEGVKAIKSAVRPGSPTSVSIGLTAGADHTPPLTSAKILSPWRIKLTTNEPGKTYYSLDGSNPSTYRSLEYKGASLTIINSTIIDAATAQLKWMSIDDNYNKEASRSLPAFLRSPFDYPTLTAYIASQNTSIPKEIKEALIKFFRDEENGKAAMKISLETSIPEDLRLNLENYLKIEDLRIQTNRLTVLNAGQRGQLDAILATYDDYNPANDAKLGDLITTLQGIDAFATLQTSAEEIRDRRDNLRKVLSYLNEAIASLMVCSKNQTEAAIKEGETKEEFAVRIAVEFARCQANARAGTFPINLNGLSSALATDPLFSELKNKTDKVILERSLFTVDPAGNWTRPSAALAPADSGHAAILSTNPSTGKLAASFFKQITWDDKPGARDGAFSQASNNNINGFYYKQAFVIPGADIPFGTHIWYGAIDAANNATEEWTSGDFNQSFEGLPPITNFVNPIAEIKTPVEKDNDGYFILNPSSSIDNDITPLISGYEWDFINESIATATPRYDFEIFDLNRDNVFETTQCLYNFLTATGKIITGIKENNRYYVKGGEEFSTTITQAYYDAAHSSPYNGAPNIKLLTLDLPSTCLNLEGVKSTKYYFKTYSAGTLASTEEITQSEYDTYINKLGQGETANKFNFNVATNSYQAVSKVEFSISTGAYENMKIVDPNNGIIKVKFTTGSGPITVNLRVTDDEGLTAVKSVVINP